MQIISLGNNLHELSAYFLGKNVIINLSYAEFAQRVVQVKFLFSLAGLTDGHYFQVKFNEAVNKVVHAKDKVIDELRKKEKEMEEEINANKGW